MDLRDVSVFKVGTVIQLVEDGSDYREALVGQGFSVVSLLADAVAANVTNNSVNVSGLTGVGAPWVGAQVVFNGSGSVYVVATAPTATTITLTSVYLGATEATRCTAFQLPTGAGGGIQPRVADALPQGA